MNVLVIYSHTYHSRSYAGKAILEVLEAQPGITVRNLEELYPDNSPIDIAAEQAALVAADIIVFQHPLFWFATPALLKRYMDEVLQYGFAYGDDSFKLAGKKFVHSYTTGAAAEVYIGGLHQNAEAALIATPMSLPRLRHTPSASSSTSRPSRLQRLARRQERALVPRPPLPSPPAVHRMADSWGRSLLRASLKYKWSGRPARLPARYRLRASAADCYPSAP